MKHTLLFIFFAIGFIPSSPFSQVLMSDSMALVDFYHATNGDSWTESTGWLTATPVGQWHGVTVEDGRVTAIYLYDNELTGPIPTSIGMLTGLRSLGLGDNQLNGTLPESIGDMTSLESLTLDVNQLTGTLPTSFANLQELNELIIYRNVLTGPFPDVVLSLPKLVYLDLSSNSFSGPLPDGLEQMSQLEYLGLDRNEFSGEMISMGNFENLREAHFDFNQLSGNLQEFMDYLPQMAYLSMSGNRIEGCLSDTFFNPDRLTFLYISDGELDCLGDFSGHNSLQRLHVNGNALTFDDLEPNFGISLILYQPQDSTLSFIDTLLEAGQSYSIEAGSGGEFTQYQWYYNGNIMDGATESVLTITDFDESKVGNYYCLMTNIRFPDLQLVRHMVSLRLDGASNVSSGWSLNWRVYPNPASDFLHIECPGYNGRISFVDQLGRVVLERIILDNHVIDIGDFSEGLYYLRMNDVSTTVFVSK